MSWDEVKYAVNSTLGTEEFLPLNELIKNIYGEKMFTSDGVFTVPNGITEIYISACAAGGDGPSDFTEAGGKAGEFIINEVFSVYPSQNIEITVGLGNTIIGNLKTLIANSFDGATSTEILGYPTGFNGFGAVDRPKSYGRGGAFGFGGGGGGGYVSNYYAPGNGGSKEAGGNSSTMATLLNGAAGISATSAGSGWYRGGAGGDAGGYGAGGGTGGAGNRTEGAGGKGSQGMVFIKWGVLANA